MSFAYLWKNRQKPKVGSPLWIKSWGKRLFTFRSLLQCELQWTYWRFRGVKIGHLSSLGCGKLHTPERLQVGHGTFIGKASIQLLNPVSIGDNVVINDGVEILTGSHDPHDSHFRHILAPVRIEDYAWIATRAMILPGVTVGRGAIVGAGAVVAKDVAPYAIVIGNPARPVNNKRTENLDYHPNMLRACYESWLGKPEPLVKS